MRRWDRLVEEYVGSCRARGLAEGSIDRILSELDRWGTWMKRRCPRRRLEEVDAEWVLAYVRSRTAFRAKATVYGAMSTMRGMGEFLVARGVWSSNPLRWLRGPKLDPRARVPRRIGSEQMEQLWAAAAGHRFVYQRHLWTAVLALLYGTGLRRGELERLDLASWDCDEGVLAVDGRKTGWMRHVPVPGLAQSCLASYLPQRQLQLERARRWNETALFVNHLGQRLAGPAVSHGLMRLTRRAGLEGVTLHAFRHSCASDLLEAGVRVPEVQLLLGHRAVMTTVRYLEIADRQRHAAVALHPINDLLAEVAA
jgi:site-specific recombinase XerD